jgi:hypothetical protein
MPALFSLGMFGSCLQLFCEELPEVGEGFELESVSGWVEEEHGGLLPDFALKPDIRLDDKLDACIPQLFCERVPLIHWKNDPEVRHWHVVSIDWVAMRLFVLWSGFEMRDNLVAEEIEVYPLLRTAAFRTAHCGPIKVPCCVEIVDREGNVKRRQLHAC